MEQDNNETKILFVVSDYLPNSSGGSIRVEKNIKYLTKVGVNCKVFTPVLNGVGKYGLINGVEVFRTKTFDLSKYFVKLKTFLKKNNISNSDQPNDIPKNTGRLRLADKFFVPDTGMIWAFFCSYKLSRVIKRNEVQIIYSSSPAASNHLIAYLVRKIWRIKFIWIIEFRDPWTMNPFRDKKILPSEYLDHKLERAVIKNCDSIIVTSQKYKDDFLEKYKSLNANKIHYIPNGYDSEDFAFLANVDKRQNHKFTILSVGGYYGRRSLLPFIKAFQLAILENPDLENQIHFIHYGKLDVASQNYLQTNSVKGIEIFSNIIHKKCIEEMYHADCLLLIPGPGDGTMPGKTYEYLATYNPILALVNEGPSKKLIEDLKAGVIININDINQIIKVLLNYNTELQIILDKKEIQLSLYRYDRKNIALEILNLIKSY